MCFTLTMWDVKNILEILLYFLNKFYLNYVGCKVINCNIWQFDNFSFTLTMWDVKLEILLSNQLHSLVLP